jgi:hypothetical protein
MRSSIIYNKNYIEMKGWVNKVNDCHWKSMESWVGTKHFVFCSNYMAFSKLISLRLGFRRNFLSVKILTENFFGILISSSTRLSLNMLPTMVHNQDFYIITWQPPPPHTHQQGSLLLPSGDALSKSAGLSPVPGNLHQYPAFHY